MFNEQINTLKNNEIHIKKEITELENKIKDKKNELTITKKAIKSLERYKEQLNVQSYPQTELHLSHQ